jgi:F-type H+-transporting ATPase subunit b
MELVKPEIGLIFWMVVTFLIVLFLLKKFAWKPILQMIGEREDSITGSLEAARMAKEELANLKATSERIIKEAHAERDTLLREARDVKDKIIAEAKASAQEEGRKIVAQAKDSITTEKNAALRELKEQVVNMAMDAASKILKQQLENPKQQEALIESYLNEVNAN